MGKKQHQASAHIAVCNGRNEMMCCNRQSSQHDGDNQMIRKCFTKWNMNILGECVTMANVMIAHRCELKNDDGDDEKDEKEHLIYVLLFTENQKS